ncbi:MAG: hypothetical protein JSR76_01535 [Verrucomicrobia bacterium]|nr:hypothetical protein [Verrucomicrobiota bacterium]
MSDHLVEIIFKEVDLKNLIPLLQYLTSEGKNVVSYYDNYDLLKIDWKQEETIAKFFKDHEECALFINLDALNIEGISLKKCGLAIYQIENRINLEINFEILDIYNSTKIDLVEALMRLSNILSKKYEIKEFFCGLEPAGDLETRLFTKDQLGPFSLPIG